MNRIFLYSFLIAALVAGCGQGVETDKNIFVWDFGKQQTYVYSYSQNVKASQKGSPVDVPLKYLLTTEGSISVKSDGSGSSDVLLVLEKSFMYGLDSNGNPKDTLPQERHEMPCPGMNRDGSFKNEKTKEFFALLFPLPPADIQEGESGEVEITMPFNAIGNAYTIRGKLRLTHAGNTQLDGKSCTLLKGSFDLNENDIPEDQKKHFKSICKGKGEFYFDAAKHCFLGADLTILMEVEMKDIYNPAIKEKMYLQMSNDNILRYRLKEIK